MKRDLTLHDCTPTRSEYLWAAIASVVVWLIVWAMLQLGGIDMEASEVTAQSMSQTIAVVKAAQVAEVK